MGSRTQFYFYLAMLMLMLASFLSNSRVKSKCIIYSTFINEFPNDSSLTLTNEVLEFGKFGPPSPHFPYGRQIFQLFFFNDQFPPAYSGRVVGGPCHSGNGTYFVSVTAYFPLSTGYSKCTATAQFVFSNNHHMYNYRIFPDSGSSKPVCSLDRGYIIAKIK